MTISPKLFTKLHGSKTIVACVALAASAVVFGGVAFPTTSATSAVAQTFSLTVSGTDAHSLDARIKPQFIDGGGVGAVYDNGQTPAGFPKYLELPFDLPVGAKVTSVAVTYSNCTEHIGSA